MGKSDEKGARIMVANNKIDIMLDVQDVPWIHDIIQQQIICGNPWWHHKTETLSALLAICKVDQSLVDSPHKWPTIQNFDVSSVVSLNELLKH